VSTIANVNCLSAHTFGVERTDLASLFAPQATLRMHLMILQGVAEKGKRRDRQGWEQQQRDSKNEQERQRAGEGWGGGGGERLRVANESGGAMVMMMMMMMMMMMVVVVVMMMLKMTCVTPCCASFGIMAGVALRQREVQFLCAMLFHCCALT
jgi:hypothetical protein